MATVVEFGSSADAFPLGSVFETLPEAAVELERLVTHETHIIPYLWVRGTTASDIEEAFANHAGLTSIRLVDSVEGEYLLRAEWNQEHVGILEALAQTNLVMLSGTGTESGWQFEVRGENREAVGAFRTYCQENDTPITITAVHALLPAEDEGYGLTDRQREALVLAYERGYFESPRESTLAEVATALDITQQSLSSRLRRGHRRLIDATIAGR
jgi:Predicted DNA binding protein